MIKEFTNVIPVLMAFLFFGGQAAAEDEEGEKTIYKMKARNAHLIRHVTGPVMAENQGIPAIPVDSFLWDGQEIKDIHGHAMLKIDPEDNTGVIHAHWTDEYGRWSYRQTMFKPPMHPTGLKVGPSANDTQLIVDDPVTTNVYLHGDTTAGGPVLPTVFNFLATWGPAKLTLNGEPFNNEFDDEPMWMGHTMISEGVRNEEGAVLTTSGEVYDMMKNGEGITYPDKMTFHLVFHSKMTMGEMTDNVPPPVKFFYHLSFSDVKLVIKHKSE